MWWLVKSCTSYCMYISGSRPGAIVVFFLFFFSDETRNVWDTE